MITYPFTAQQHLRLAFLLAIAFGCATSATFAADEIAGNLITLTNTPAAPNGTWSWFEDERAIIDDSDPANTKLLVSSVSYAPSGSERGDVDLLWLNVDTGAQGHVELKDRLEVPDDHNSAALWQRPDGRYLALYSTHNNDNLTRYRISTNPNDPTSWQPEQLINNNAPTTYSNVHYLPNDRGGAGRLYNFTRASNFDPTVVVSENQGASWISNGYKLVTEGNSAARPYARYYSDGDKIHVTITEQHPRNFQNSIYHAYIQDGQLFSSTGSLLDSNLFNGSALRPNQLTPVFTNGSIIDGDRLQRAWTTDVAIDTAGNPVTVFTARVNDDDDDHRLLYARFNGSSWEVEQLAKAGGFLYSPENDYTGLASIDPNDTSTVFISTEIDPRNDQLLTHYEIFRGIRDEASDVWAWDPITFDSSVDNLRPLVPEWNTTETALIWMRGNYNTFQDWDTEVVALTEITSLTDVPSPADLNTSGSVDLEDFSIFQSNLLSDVSNLNPLQSILLGDFDGDLDIDYTDFVFFSQEYNKFNGSNALSLALAVPEPATWQWMIALIFARGMQTNRLVSEVK